MIEEHLDPTTEAHAHVTNLLRTVVTAAAGVAERRARQREDQQRDAQQRDAQHRTDDHRRALNERLAAERHTAHVVYRRAYQDFWWDKARPDDIAAAVEAAGTWAAGDPRAGDALHHIAERLRDRYGIDLRDLYRTAQDPAVVPGTVRDHLAALEPTPAETAPVDPWDAKAAVLKAAGPTLGAEILAAEGWHHLQRRLETMHEAGADVPGQLRRAVTERELDTARDKGLAVAWRLKAPAAASHTADTQGAAAARRASHGARRPGSPSKASGSTQAARRFAENQRRTDSQREGGPEATAGP